MFHVKYSPSEDKVFDDYITKNNSKSNSDIADLIKKDRPAGIHPSRYDGKTTIYQHVRVRRKLMEGVA